MTTSCPKLLREFLRVKCIERKRSPVISSIKAREKSTGERNET
jgi:hypothetical protein